MKQDDELRNMSNGDLLDLYTSELKWQYVPDFLAMSKPSGYSSAVLWDEIINRMTHGVDIWRKIRK